MKSVHFRGVDWVFEEKKSQWKKGQSDKRQATSNNNRRTWDTMSAPGVKFFLDFAISNDEKAAAAPNDSFCDGTLKLFRSSHVVNFTSNNKIGKLQELVNQFDAWKETFPHCLPLVQAWMEKAISDASYSRPSPSTPARAGSPQLASSCPNTSSPPSGSFPSLGGKKSSTSSLTSDGMFSSDAFPARKHDTPFCYPKCGACGLQDGQKPVQETASSHSEGL